MAPIIGILASSQTANIVTSSFESIASATGTGSNTTITFSNIPQTYQHLQIRGIWKDTWSTASFATLELWLNNTAGGGTAYANHRLIGNGSTASANGGASNSSIDGINAPTSGSGLTDMYGAFIIDIHDYTSTSKYKTVRYFSGTDANASSTNWQVRLGSGLYQSTSAITQIDLHDTAYYFAAGSTIALYGIKG